MDDKLEQEFIEEIRMLKLHNIRLMNSIESFLAISPKYYGEGDIIQARQAMRIAINNNGA